MPWLLGVPIILFHYLNFTDDVERTTPADPQDPTAEDPPVAHETEAEVSQPRRSPSPSMDVPQEEAAAEEEQQKEDESN